MIWKIVSFFLSCIIFFDVYGVSTGNIINIKHPINGELPKTIRDIAYDVDSSQSVSLEDLKNLVEYTTTNTGNNYYSDFHYRPNIINLSEIKFQDSELYDKILWNIIDNNSLKQNINNDISKNNRIFLARDFITNVYYNGIYYYEIHYAFIINLDQKYVHEILLPFSPWSLYLHDSHIDNLTTIFSNTSIIKTWEVWELCLRGNFKKEKYNSIIIDKLSKDDFYIQRVHLNCWNSVYIKDDLPLYPKNFPINKNPPPIWPEKEVPLPPHTPLFPIPPITKWRWSGKVTSAPIVRPWPFGYPETWWDLWKEINEPKKNNDNCDESKIDLKKKLEILKKLEEEKWKMEKELNDDIKTINKYFTCYSGQWNYKAKFNSKCINSIYNRYNKKVKKINDEIEEIQDEISKLYEKIRILESKLSEILQIYLYINSIWENMLTVNGKWAQVTTPCGWWILMPWTSAGSPNKIDVSPEQQRKFQQDVAYALMNWKTWEEAIKNAILKNTPENYQWWGEETTNYIWKYVWETYAKCLKTLYQKQLKIYFGIMYPDISDKDITRLIKIMFEREKWLKSSEKVNIRKIEEIMDKVKKLINKKIKKEEELWYIINDTRRKFRKEIKKCLKKERENIQNIQQEIRILQAFLEYCNSGNWRYEISYIDIKKLCSVLKNMLENELFNTNKALVKFIKQLLKENCKETQEPEISQDMQDRLDLVLDNFNRKINNNYQNYSEKINKLEKINEKLEEIKKQKENYINIFDYIIGKINTMVQSYEEMEVKVFLEWLEEIIENIDI